MASTDLCDVMSQLVKAQLLALERSEAARDFSLREEFYKLCSRRALRFDGKVDGSVKLFLVNVFDIATKLNVSDKIFLDVFPDLLVDDARIWFYAFGRNYQTMDGLAEAILDAFLPPLYDSLLLKTIRNRTQDMSESIVMFVSKIVSSNKLLCSPLEERELVELIASNVNPLYIGEMVKGRPQCLQDILVIGKLVEEIQAMQKCFVPPIVKAVFSDLLSVEPDLSHLSSRQECKILVSETSSYQDVDVSSVNLNPPRVKTSAKKPKVRKMHVKEAEVAQPSVCGVAITNAEPDVVKDKWFIKLRKKILIHKDKYPSFRVDRNRIFKRTSDREWKLLVPKDRREVVLREVHDATSSPHPGFCHVLEKLRTSYYWPKMAKDVERFVNNLAKSNSDNINMQIS